MSATDDLRRMLGERGAKWRTYFVDGAVHTTWNDAACWFTELEDGTTVWGEAMEGSPADAVEATLGRGECEDIGTDRFVCSKCGCTLDIEDAASCEPIMWVDGEAGVPRYCPNCGAKVMSE